MIKNNTYQPQNVLFHQVMFLGRTLQINLLSRRVEYYWLLSGAVNLLSKLHIVLFSNVSI